jgi:hypothetical protein
LEREKELSYAKKLPIRWKYDFYNGKIARKRAGQHLGKSKKVPFECGHSADLVKAGQQHGTRVTLYFSFSKLFPGDNNDSWTCNGEKKWRLSMASFTSASNLRASTSNKLASAMA